MLLRNLLVILVAAISQAAFANLGEPDPSFGEGGFVVALTDCFPSCATVTDVRPLPDGGLVHLNADPLTGGGRLGPLVMQTSVTRRTPSGRLDPAFGTGGTVGLDLHTRNLETADVIVQVDGALAVQADGGILVATMGASGLVISRLAPDGLVDGTFGAGGSAAGIGGYRVARMALQSNGAILVLVMGPVAAVQRFTSQGVIDTSYGIGGTAVLPWPAGAVRGYRGGLALLPDGRAVVARALGGTLEVTRLSTEGAVDPAYAAQVATTTAAGLFPQGMAVMPDGGVVVPGADATGSMLVRISPGGAPDAAFGPSGARNYVDGGAVLALSMQADGRIAGAGSIAGYMAVMRWHPDGTPDVSLRNSGHALSTVTGEANAIALQDDGRAVLATTAALYGGVARFGATLDLFHDDSLFARQQYIDFFGREPDAPGLQFWVRNLSSGGVSRAALAGEFFDAAEFQVVQAAITRAYLAAYLRYPSEPELLFWAAELRSGRSIESIMSAFVLSFEFQGRFGALDHAGYVDHAYRNVLGRPPDPEGLAYWTNRLDTLANNQITMLLRFAESGEYRTATQAGLVAYMAYRGFLRRDPDPPGLAYWTAAAASAPRLKLIQAFLESSEYLARFKP